jgi:hypothetical protein
VQRRIRPDLDIVLDILQQAVEAKPSSAFAKSLLLQYLERGGLSKKQLEGLASMAAKIPSIPAGRLATLEAIILKKAAKSRSALPENKPLYTKDERIGAMISRILEKAPQHKRVIFLSSKFENNEPLSSAEITELERFSRLLK